MATLEPHVADPHAMHLTQQTEDSIEGMLLVRVGLDSAYICLHAIYSIDAT